VLSATPTFVCSNCGGSDVVTTVASVVAALGALVAIWFARKTVKESIASPNDCSTSSTPREPSIAIRRKYIQLQAG
jgi:hypothetical protein